MKLTVITNRSGRIVGTARHGDGGYPVAGRGGPIAGPGQAAHVIDLPSELEALANAEELHRKLEPLLAARAHA